MAGYLERYHKRKVTEGFLSYGVVQTRGCCYDEGFTHLE